MLRRIAWAFLTVLLVPSAASAGALTVNIVNATTEIIEGRLDAGEFARIPPSTLKGIGLAGNKFLPNYGTHRITIKRAGGAMESYSYTLMDSMRTDSGWCFREKATGLESVFPGACKGLTLKAGQGQPVQ